MARIPDGQTPAEHFGEQYRVRRSRVMREMERVVCGCDYGGTSWTTRAEAEQVGRLLRLCPGKWLLELGAGSGWPGLFLARTTGCTVTLVDVPLEAIRIAAERAMADQLDGACSAAVATTHGTLSPTTPRTSSASSDPISPFTLKRRWTREAHVALFRLRANRAPFLRATLRKWGRVDSASCLHCGAASEHTEHFLLECPHWAAARAAHLGPRPTAKVLQKRVKGVLDFLWATGVLRRPPYVN